MSEKITTAEISALIKKGEAVYVRLRGPLTGLLLAKPTGRCGTYIFLTPVVTVSGVDAVCQLGSIQVPVAAAVWHPAGTHFGGQRGELVVTAEGAESAEGGSEK